jgi:hypothetical protein
LTPCSLLPDRENNQFEVALDIDVGDRGLVLVASAGAIGGPGKVELDPRPSAVRIPVAFALAAWRQHDVTRAETT